MNLNFANKQYKPAPVTPRLNDPEAAERVYQKFRGMEIAERQAAKKREEAEAAKRCTEAVTTEKYEEAVAEEKHEEAENRPTEKIDSGIGFFSVKSANQWMTEAKEKPMPKPLFGNLWYENEVCCMFADSNVGKSILAVQIATRISTRHKVLYFDFELSDKQFQLRYTSENGEMIQFPENFMRAQIDPYKIKTSNIETSIVAEIERVSLVYKADVVIIDNLTYLSSAVESGDAAGELMIQLTTLKKKHGWSMLILAHTPKRLMTNPITQNDLAGSKRLFNFFDSVFAIGKSCKDEELRYLKQIKVRNAKFEYGADNVLVSQIVKENGFLRFEKVGFSEETDHLKVESDADKIALANNIRSMNAAGNSLRDIAIKLGVSKSRVHRIISKNAQEA